MEGEQIMVLTKVGRALRLEQGKKWDLGLTYPKGGLLQPRESTSSAGNPCLQWGKREGHRRLVCTSCRRLSQRGQKGPVPGQWPPGQQEGGGGLDPRASVCVYRVAGYPVGLGVGWGGEERSKDGKLDAHWVQG